MPAAQPYDTQLPRCSLSHWLNLQKLKFSLAEWTLTATWYPRSMAWSYSSEPPGSHMPGLKRICSRKLSASVQSYQCSTVFCGLSSVGMN